MTMQLVKSHLFLSRFCIHLPLMTVVAVVAHDHVYNGDEINSFEIVYRQVETILHIKRTNAQGRK